LGTLLSQHGSLDRVNKAREWAARLGVRESGLTGKGAFFLNGAYFPFDQVSISTLGISSEPH